MQTAKHVHRNILVTSKTRGTYRSTVCAVGFRLSYIYTQTSRSTTQLPIKTEAKDNSGHVWSFMVLSGQRHGAGRCRLLIQPIKDNTVQMLSGKDKGSLHARWQMAASFTPFNTLSF